MFRVFPSAKLPIRRKRRVALGDDTRTRFDGGQLDEDRDQDQGDAGGIYEALNGMSHNEASAIASEAIRKIQAEMDKDGRLPDGEVLTEEQLKALKDELAADCKHLPTMEILDRVMTWMRSAIRSRQQHDHGHAIANKADAFARHHAFGRQEIGLSNTKKFPLYT